jgi:hypothetical protein
MTTCLKGTWTGNPMREPYNNFPLPLQVLQTQNISKSWATQKEKHGKCSTESPSDKKMKLHLENLCKFVTTNTIQAANSEL